MTRIFGLRSRHMVETSERVLGHVAASVVGLILMVAGLGMGVTIVMLPVGLVVGIVGVLLFVWGVVGHSDAHDRDSAG